jgi:hypothetical protein
VTVRFGALVRPEPGEDPLTFTARLEAAIHSLAAETAAETAAEKALDPGARRS